MIHFRHATRQFYLPLRGFSLHAYGIPTAHAVGHIPPALRACAHCKYEMQIIASLLSYDAPRPRRTTGMVLRKIFRSSVGDQLSMY